MAFSINRRSLLASVGSIALAAVPVASRAHPETSEPETIGAPEARDIALQAYLYFYPLVSMGVTREQTNAVPGAPPDSLSNSFFHVRTFPPADFRLVVRSNFDTLYSTAWLDLTREPMIVSVPDTAGRYYVLPMLDMWTDVFAAPGKRATGTESGHFAIVPPAWSGNLPTKVTRIDAPTPHVWVVGRTQTNGPQDYAAVNVIQDGYTVTPVSQWGRSPALVAPMVPVKFPALAPREQVDSMRPFAFFKYAAELMRTNPPHVTDWSIVQMLKRIGIEVGQTYCPEQLDPIIRGALMQAVPDGQNAMRAAAATIARVANGWQMNIDTIGVYGNAYLKRAVIARNLLGANQPEDAIYPFLISDADGKPATGENKYVVHFDRNDLPPVGAFWSLSMYDAQGFQVANPIDRFALGDRDKLRFNPDGSLDIYIQHDHPAEANASNWLPSPATGALGLTMRLYAPGADVLDGSWAPPPLRRHA